MVKGTSKQQGKPHGVVKKVHVKDSGKNEKKSGNQDTSTAIEEDQWYTASSYMTALRRMVREWQGQRDLSCLDLFGASGAVKRTWARHHKKAELYDIKNYGLEHDICSEGGFKNLLQLGLRIKDGGIIVAGPPCSLFIFLSSPIHRRSPERPWGNTNYRSVRLANFIVHNMTTFLQLMSERGVEWVIEQPSGSGMFRLPPLQQLMSKVAASQVTTYMGCFGHKMMKRTMLVGTLPLLHNMERSLRGEERQRFREMQKNFYVRCDGKVRGEKALQASADYTSEFCEALYSCWLTK